MPDFTQSVQGLEPPTVVDHVLLPVADLEVGAQRFYERFGLKGIPGGRHPGVGTANVIVPLGLQYLELIAVVDQGEAASSHRDGSAALRRVVVGARDPRRVRDLLEMLLGDSVSYEVREARLDGVQRVVLETTGGELVLE